MHCFVTGADGFIGSHLVEALVRRGDRVRAFVWYNSAGSRGCLDDVPREVQDDIEIVAGDIRDSSQLNEAMQGGEVVFHLAALIGVPYSYKAPDSYIDTNVKGTLNVLQAARACGVSKLVHTSTSEVYGTAITLPISEQHRLMAKSPYAASKIAADQLVSAFHASFDLPAAIIRPFNTYGPRQSLRAVIPTIIAQLLSARRRLHLGSLTPTRDFSYVDDIVRAFIAVADSPRTIGEVVNIGTGVAMSIRQTAETIGRVMGREVEFDRDAERVRPAGSEVEHLAADTTKATELLGWAPRYRGQEGLERGIAETVAWFNDERRRASPYRDQYAV